MIISQELLIVSIAQLICRLFSGDFGYLKITFFIQICWPCFVMIGRGLLNLRTIFTAHAYLYDELDNETSVNCMMPNA